MKKLSYFLSFIYPVSVEITSSKCNPFLEIVLFDGKYSLNSRNTNYSFGTLHTLFTRIFRKLNFNWKRINEVLVLGFGTGNITEIIGKYNPDCHIDGVEIDNKVIELGIKYFNTDALKNVEIICAPADEYIKKTCKKYDLIITDVFLDMLVPEEIESEQFLVHIRDSLNPGGVTIFNKVTYTKSIRDQIPILANLYKKIFGNLDILTIMTSGKIFVARK